MKLIYDRNGNIVSFGRAFDPTADDIMGNLGAEGQTLIVAAGRRKLEWGAASGGSVAAAVASDLIWDAKGDLAAGTGANTAVRVPVGANGQVLTADSVETAGLKWTTPSSGSSGSGNVLVDPAWAAKGDVLGGTGNDAAAILGVGTNGQMLTADSAEATGLRWTTFSGGSGASGIPVDGWISSGETWTYASADDPTFTFTITGDLTGKYQAGQRVKLTQTTAKYFIITAVAHSAGTTTVTVYGGTDYDLANAAITLPFYSVVKAPFGFPLNPIKWTVEVTDVTIRQQTAPTVNVWYNLGSISISIPIGCWDVNYNVALQMDENTTASSWTIQSTLSTANNSESDADFTCHVSVATAAYGATLPALKEKTLLLAAKTSYFLNTRTTTTGLDDIYNRNDQAKLIIRARCAYL